MERIFETIYARNSTGGFKQWQIKVEELGIYGVITMLSGKVGGKQSVKTSNIKQGLQGRTVYQQALNEAEAKFKHKKKEGYKTLEEAGIANVIPGHTGTLINMLEIGLPKFNTTEDGSIKVMKAQPYMNDNGEPRITFPCLGQPKLNGFRCSASLFTEKIGMFDESKIKFQSKEGLKYDILEHIAKDFELLDFDIQTSKLVFDGEMYIHGEILSEISSAVRKRNPKTELLKYYIFDLAIDGVPQKERLEMLESLFTKPALIFDNDYTIESGNLVLVKHEIINNHEEATHYFNRCIEAGYEGAIFRSPSTTYKFGQRPKTMVKMKKFEDAEFEILAVIPQKVNPLLAQFVCKNNINDEVFEVVSEGTVEKKMEYLQNASQLVGKMATIKFAERTKTGKPFHTTLIDIRDYE